MYLDTDNRPPITPQLAFRVAVIGFFPQAEFGGRPPDCFLAAVAGYIDESFIDFDQFPRFQRGNGYDKRA